MTPRPRLATLLTLRRTEHDEAAAELADASRRHRDAEAVAARTRTALDHLAPAAAGLHELRAIASARLAAANMLDELWRGEAESRAVMEEASAAYTSASARLRSVEKLRERAEAAEREEELAREQAVLDEIAQRRREGAA
jgi:flagellar export protein FliJ